MAPTVIRPEQRVDIVFSTLTLSLVGTAAALNAIGCEGASLLERVVALISAPTIAGNLRPGAPTVVGFMSFIAGVVGTPWIRNFGGTSRRWMMVAVAGSKPDDHGAVLQTAVRRETDRSACTVGIPGTVGGARQVCSLPVPGIAVNASMHEPSSRARSVREARVPRAAKLCALVTMSLGLWWGIWVAARAMASAWR